MEREILDKHIDELYELILKLKSKEDCKKLLDDLCTFKEVEQMALRAYAAKLFLSGKTYAEIIEKTELSSATISRVSRSISYGSGGYKSFIEIEKDED
jgi:TrpR-related protein YerC/YecD